MTGTTDFTDFTDRLAMSAEELAEADQATNAIDFLTQTTVEISLAIADGDAAPATALVIAEGVLARLISALAKVDGSGDALDREALDRVLEISATHVRNLVDHYWQHLQQVQAERDAASDT